ncbi:MAG: hypothetical protein A2007_06065 [Verrucomicrobia bacterium GWC2_42_7]|nr:MAG: hypothetical protein A2007_06065 [Verrucomicrobia bacterium GWC2_42_7]
MILDELVCAEMYYQMHPLFKRAFLYLEQLIKREPIVGERFREEVSVGKGVAQHSMNSEIDLSIDKQIKDDCIYSDAALVGIIESVHGRGEDNSPLEVHRKFIDIQYVVSGCEKIGWKSLHQMKEEKEPYNAERDIGFFHDKPDFWMTLKPGQFALFFPNDGHAPLAGLVPVRKIIIKVPCHSKN